jgi:hypothetical protein
MNPSDRIRESHGGLVWRLHDGTNTLEGYLADCGSMGVESRLCFNGSFSFSARFATLEEACAVLAFHHTGALRRGFVQVFPATSASGVA